MEAKKNILITYSKLITHNGDRQSITEGCLTSVQEINKYIRRVIGPFANIVYTKSADKVDDANIRIIVYESAAILCHNQNSLNDFISELESTFTEKTIIVMVLIYHIYDWWPWSPLQPYPQIDNYNGQRVHFVKCWEYINRSYKDLLWDYFRITVHDGYFVTDQKETDKLWELCFGERKYPESIVFMAPMLLL